MLHLNKRTTAIVLVFWFFFSVTKILACDCRALSTEDAVQKSEMVFSGKVVGFEYRKDIPNQFMESREKDSGKHIDYETMVIKFQVERWWKGEASLVVFLITNSTKNADGTSSRSSCDYSFRKGESYLVYAFGKHSELRTTSCMRTQSLSNAEEDLKTLGEGKEPIQENQQDFLSFNDILTKLTFTSRISKSTEEINAQLIKDVQNRKVNFILSSEVENSLKKADASEFLIKAIRENLSKILEEKLSCTKNLLIIMQEIWSNRKLL